MLHTGWDAFNCDSGTVEEKICRVCHEICKVDRDVDEPRTQLMAMVGHRQVFDHFYCANSEEEWHLQALFILKLAEETPSARFEKMLKQEAHDIVTTKKATKKASAAALARFMT